MNDIIDFKELDLNATVYNSVNGVFDMMLDIQVEFSDEIAQWEQGTLRVVGAVSFTGKATGRISIQMDGEFAKMITCGMLGMEEDEISAAEMRDAIGEISNMIGGNLKSGLCNEGFTCELSVPVVTAGSDFTIESLNWGIHEQYSFEYLGHQAVVDVCIKTTE